MSSWTDFWVFAESPSRNANHDDEPFTKLNRSDNDEEMITLNSEKANSIVVNQVINDLFIPFS